MKKIISVILILSMLLGYSAATADGMGVQQVGGPTEEPQTMDLDDLKLNVTAVIPGFGELTATSFETVNILKYYSTSTWISDFESGVEADYILLKFDILNTTTQPRNYLTDVTVKVVSDDLYEFSGWTYQYNWNKSKDVVLRKDDFYEIQPMYMGHFAVGCTLPNAVIERKTPLRLEFVIGGYEMTYHVRK